MRPLALKTIVVATDLSDAVAPALRTAVRLAGLTNGRLHIVHAREDHEPVVPDPVFQQLRELGVEGEVPFEIVVQAGPPGAIVGQEALRVGADVVVLGPHRGSIPGTFGGTADRVVRAFATPCLILPVELPLPLQRALVPIDSSSGARGALAVGLTWASALRQRTARTCVVALHVIPDSAGDHDRDDTEVLKSEVEHVRQQLSNVAHVDVESVIVYDEPAGQTILDYAHRNPIDLIVIGTRGRSMAKAAILGSVSSVVARSSDCPVLLVPPEIWSQED